MMALIAGDFEQAERMGRRRMEVAAGLQRPGAELLRGAHDLDVVAAGRAASPCEHLFREVDRAGRRPTIPIVGAALALVHAEAGETDEAMADLDALASIGWEAVADDQTEGVSLALAAAAVRRARRRAATSRVARSTSRCVPTPARPS